MFVLGAMQHAVKTGLPLSITYFHLGRALKSPTFPYSTICNFPLCPLRSPTNIVFPLQILYICMENTLICQGRNFFFALCLGRFFFSNFFLGINFVFGFPPPPITFLMVRPLASHGQHLRAIKKERKRRYFFLPVGRTTCCFNNQLTSTWRQNSSK